MRWLTGHHPKKRTPPNSGRGAALLREMITQNGRRLIAQRSTSFNEVRYDGYSTHPQACLREMRQGAGTG